MSMVMEMPLPRQAPVCTCAMNADGSSELPYDADCAKHGRVDLPARYRCTPASLARAVTEAAKERAEVDAACRAYDLERHAAMMLLTELNDRFGAADVSKWQRNICAGLGLDGV